MRLTRRYLFGSVILLLFFSGSCKDIALLHKDINYEVPTINEMQAAYGRNAPVYDSIAALSFLIFDMAIIKNNHISQVAICDDNVNLSRTGGNGQHTYSLIEIKTLLEKDSAYTRVKTAIQNCKKSISIPECIDVYEKKVSIPYKKIKESVKGAYYKSFVFTRNGEFFAGDSISHNVRSN